MSEEIGTTYKESIRDSSKEDFDIVNKNSEILKNKVVDFGEVIFFNDSSGKIYSEYSKNLLLASFDFRNTTIINVDSDIPNLYMTLIKYNLESKNNSHPASDNARLLLNSIVEFNRFSSKDLEEGIHFIFENKSAKITDLNTKNGINRFAFDFTQQELDIYSRGNIILNKDRSKILEYSLQTKNYIDKKNLLSAFEYFNMKQTYDPSSNMKKQN